jgi:hypothetical protein
VQHCTTKAKEKEKKGKITTNKTNQPTNQTTVVVNMQEVSSTFTCNYFMYGNIFHIAS